MFQTDRLKTGCIEIDEMLGGGLLCPGVTEVAGESSSGKTQFCLQTCIATSIFNPGHSMTSEIILWFEILIYEILHVFLLKFVLKIQNTLLKYDF